MTALEGNWLYYTRHGDEHQAYVYTVKFKDEKTYYCYETIRFLMELSGSWIDVYDASDILLSTDESFEMSFVTRSAHGDDVMEFLDSIISKTALQFRTDDVKAICDSWTEMFFRGIPLEDILGQPVPTKQEASA